MDLGTDPGKYIMYPGGNSFYFKETIEEALKEKGAKFPPDELERVLMPFVDPYIRRVVQRFEKPSSVMERWKGFSSDELLKLQRELHSFDKRRICYLRTGQVNMGNLEARPWKFLNVLLEKSRDEIEQFMEEMEQVLRPDEIRPYLFTALQLQTHFRHLLTRNHPAALDPEKVDHYFLEDLCRLNKDERFFRGVEIRNFDTLHPYLTRYLILYFDNAFDYRSIWDEYLGDFIGRHQYDRPHRYNKSISRTEQEACKCLGISVEEFAKMNRRELIRCYRRCAKVAHPDKGGDKDRFVRIKGAYECLLRLKY